MYFYHKEGFFLNEEFLSGLFRNLHVQALVFSSAQHSKVSDFAAGDVDIRDVMDNEDFNDEDVDEEDDGSESQGCSRILSRVILSPVLMVRHLLTRSMAPWLMFGDHGGSWHLMI